MAAVPIRHAAVNRTAVSIGKQIIRAARAGNVKSLAVVWINGNGQEIHTGYANPNREVYKLIGAIDAMKMEIWEAVVER